MSSRIRILIGIVLLAFLLLASGCLQEKPAAPPQVTVPSTASLPPSPGVSPAPAQLVHTKEDLVAFVKEAVAYARANGKEKALAEFSNRNGTFFRGDLYIYAYDTNGTTIAHPVNPEKIGVNRLNETDAEGNFFIRDLRAAALNGTGFDTYYYINPSHNNAVEKKLGYVEMVDPSWWLGSGIYYGPAATTTPSPVPSASPATTSAGG